MDLVAVAPKSPHRQKFMFTRWPCGPNFSHFAIYHHWVDITQYKSLFHYGKSPFLAYLGLPLPEGGIKSWPQAWFHMATNHVEVTQAIGPTFGIIKSKKLSNNPLESISTIPFLTWIRYTFLEPLWHEESHGTCSFFQSRRYQNHFRQCPPFYLDLTNFNSNFVFYEKIMLGSAGFGQNWT